MTSVSRQCKMFTAVKLISKACAVTYSIHNSENIRSSYIIMHCIPLVSIRTFN